MEIWKPLERMPGYEVSSFGKVRSSKGRKPRILKIATNNIIERTGIILNKSENPFRIVDNESLSFDLFYSILVKELRETGLLQDVKFEFLNFDRKVSKSKIISKPRPHKLR